MASSPSGIGSGDAPQTFQTQPASDQKNCDVAIEVIKSANAHPSSSTKTVFGPEIYPALGKHWGCELESADKEMPEIPPFDPEKYAMIYLPAKVRVDGEEKDLTLNTLLKIMAKEKFPT